MNWKQNTNSKLIIHNIHRRKYIKVKCKDLVSWVGRKQEFVKHFVKIAIFCWNILNENIAKLVIDNAICEKLQLKLTQGKILQVVIMQSNSHEHYYSIHCTIFAASCLKRNQVYF